LAGVERLALARSIAPLPPTGGQLPQSVGQLLQSSPAWQMPLPHGGEAPVA